MGVRDSILCIETYPPGSVVYFNFILPSLTLLCRFVMTPVKQHAHTGGLTVSRCFGEILISTSHFYQDNNTRVESHPVRLEKMHVNPMVPSFSFYFPYP